jgi:hypothetical protein
MNGVSQNAFPASEVLRQIGNSQDVAVLKRLIEKYQETVG